MVEREGERWWRERERGWEGEQEGKGRRERGN